MLKNAPFLNMIGVDTAEKEPVSYAELRAAALASEGGAYASSKYLLMTVGAPQFPSGRTPVAEIST